MMGQSRQQRPAALHASDCASYPAGDPEEGDTRIPWDRVSPRSGEGKEGGLLDEGVRTVGDNAGVGEAEVLRFTENDMVEYPDSEDLRGRS